MKIIFKRICLLGVFALAACGGGSDKPPVTEGDDDGGEVTDPNGGQKAPAPWTNVTFTTEDAEVRSPSQPAGEGGKLVRGADGALYYAYYRVAPNQACDIAIFGGGPAPSLAWDLVVAVKGPSATSFAVETLPLGSVGATENRAYITNPNGLDATMVGNNLVVAAPAGGDGQFTCGSSDLVVARRTGANAYAFTIPASDSSDGPAPTAGHAPEEPDELCPEDGKCSDGDDVGAWASIAPTSSGYAIAYVDTHFTTDQDGLTLADYELWEGTSAFTLGAVSGIRMWSGAGRWGTLREIGGRLVAAYSTYPRGAGATVAIQQNDGTWRSEDQSFGAFVGERVRLEVAPNGNVGLAYYAIKDNSDRTVEDLWFCESEDDGVTFPAQLCSRPETATVIAGANPSLAYDSQSRPVLSYYYCGSNGCPNDGLRVAWRDNTGKWWKYNVRNIANNRSGFYSSVVIDPTTDEPIIAFQDLTRGAAMVAYGNF